MRDKKLISDLLEEVQCWLPSCGSGVADVKEQFLRSGFSGLGRCPSQVMPEASC